MARPPIYIPIRDPFAILGISLLFVLIICATLLLIFTARKSASDARKAVRVQNRYQRLYQLNRREQRKAEDESRKNLKGKGKMREGPTITITAPSTSSSLRSTVGKIPTKPAKEYHGLKHNNDHNNNKTSPGPMVPGQDPSPSSSLLSVPSERTSVPPALRVGRQSTRFKGGPVYQTIRENDSEEDLAEGEDWWREV